MIGGQIRSLVPWSRILSDREIVLVINTDADNSRTAWVTIDASLHKPGESLTCTYSTDIAQIWSKADIEPRNGLALLLTVPAGEFIIFE
jgi:hypothetical protein